MATYTLRPNGDVSNSGAWAWTLSSGTSFSNLLKDVDNHVTEVTSTGQSDRFITMSLDNATGLIPADERIVSIRAFCEYYDDRMYALPDTATFPAEIGLACAGYGTQYGAQYHSRHDASHIMTFKGPLLTAVPTRPDIPLTHALLDGMNIVIHSKISTNFYGVWVEVTTTTVGTLDVTGPSGTITDRGPTITWTYSPTQSRQSRANVQVFAGSGAPNFAVDIPVATGDITGSASSWKVYVPAGTGVEGRGSPLPDGPYRAYVWVQDSGVNEWIGPDYIGFTVSDPVNTPTLASPADNATTNTSTPTLFAVQDGQVGGAKVKLEFQVASEETFTNDLQTITEPNSALRVSGTGSMPVPVGLAQGSWNWRARSVDEYGTAGSWTALRTLVVSHAPSTSNWTPSLGSSVAYTGSVALVWTFTDPWSGDSQSAFQVRGWAGADPGTLIFDSGVTVSATQGYTATGIGTGLKDDVLYWQVRVRDQDDVWSAWSPPALFYTSDVPTVTITAPSNGATVTTSTPTVAWTFSASGGRVQSAWRVVITNEDTSTDIYDTEWNLGTDTSYVLPIPVIDLLTNYSVTVYLKDNNGLTGSDNNIFTASYTLPDPVVFTLDSATYTTTGLVTVDWSTATEDGNFEAWRVYRRPTGTTDWSLIASTGSGTQVWSDYTSPSGIEVEYAVVQAISTFGLTVETLYQPQATTNTSDKYFLVVPSSNSLNICLHNVRADSFDDEKEMSVIKLIGRGRRVEQGTKYGKTGQLEVAFYDVEVPAITARAQRLAVEAIRDAGLPTYLRNPFGDVWQVALESMNVQRIAGVGLREFATASLTYTEITSDQGTT